MKIGSICICEKIDRGMLVLEEKGMKIPSLRREYTVRDIGVHRGKPWIMLEEIINRPHDWSNGFSECAFDVKSFREIEFPPSLEKEISECLTRELETVTV